MEPGEPDTRQRLMDAGEVLFARDGVDVVTIRELNRVAGQHNSSALHYHFGSRQGLVNAILLKHQSEIDVALERRLDRLVDRSEPPTVHELVTAVVGPMADKIRTESGRAWAQIVPQHLPAICNRLRHDEIKSVTPQVHRFMELIVTVMPPASARVRRERLVAYATTVTTLLAERAHQLDSGQRLPLGHDAFVINTADTLTAILTAPSSLPDRPAPPRPIGHARSAR